MNRVTKINGMNYIARNQYCDYNAVLTDIQLEAANQQCIDKLGELEDIEEELGCPLKVVYKLAKQNELFYQFFDELQHHQNIKVDIKNGIVWYCKQVGGHYACQQPLSNYGKTFWLREDKSE